MTQAIGRPKNCACPWSHKMWKKIVQRFTSDDPIEPITNEFMQMLELTRTMSGLVHPNLFTHNQSKSHTKEVFDLDVQVIKLELFFFY